MTQPQIIIGGAEGHHNEHPTRKHYRDLSTVCVVPTRGTIHARVVENWMGLASPMNQKFARLFVTGMEVGAAYNAAIEQILANPELSTWKYLLTLEEDNMPPPDGLIKLLDRLPLPVVDKGDLVAVGGLYWTKGEGGQPMCYGPEGQVGFGPFLHDYENLNYCNGLGMGFTLWKLDLFRKMEGPWFETLQQYDPQTGAKAATQDLNFCGKVKDAGYRLACDPQVKVGHFDAQTGIVW